MTDYQYGTSTPARRFLSDAQAKPESGKPGSAIELAKRILLLRQMRNMRWENVRFADPAWDILLGLFVAHHEAKVVTRSDAVTMAAVPSTTARRAVRHLITAKLLTACPDPTDRRRQFLRMDSTLVRELAAMLEKMARYPHWTDVDRQGADRNGVMAPRDDLMKCSLLSRSEQAG